MLPSIGFRVLLFLSLGVVFLSCKQFEYFSPSPGILDVRLTVKNSRTDLIPFASSNSFALTVVELRAYKADGTFLRVLADLNAIRRKADGDTLNCLLPQAQDSIMILGREYAPPTTFTELRLEIKPSPIVIVQTGISPSIIQVLQPNPAPATLRTLSGLNLQVETGKTTRVVVTLDLDATLVRRTETFEYHPTLYISSIQTF